MPARTPAAWEVPTALGVALLLGFRYPLVLGIPVGFVVAGALTPVSIGVWRRFRWIAVLVILSTTAAVSGALLTWQAATDGAVTDPGSLLSGTARILLLGFGTMTLLWVRSVVGTRRTVLAFGVGALLTVLTGVVEVNPDNPWKFSFSVPVALLLLSQRRVHGRLGPEVVGLLLLAGMSAINDSRSLAAMLILAAATLLLVRPVSEGRRSPAIVAGGAALVGVGGFFAVQAALREGILGEAAQERTLEQTRVAGNVLLGGRPEIGATLQLMAEQPWGYGTGTLASATDVLTGKQGMARLGYDPNNGYVERYMFGDGFELHSLAGDLWVAFGLAGLALAGVVAVVTASGMARALAERTATGVMLFLGIRTLWDLAFSPFLTTMNTVMLALAVVLPAMRSGAPRGVEADAGASAEASDAAERVGVGVSGPSPAPRGEVGLPRC